MRPGQQAPYHYDNAAQSQDPRFKPVYELTEPVKPRFLITLFDITVALTGLLLTSPIWLLMILTHWIEGIFIPSHRGAIFTSYIASSAGKKFMKYKFRLVKGSLIPKDFDAEKDWRALPSEREPGNLSYTGRVVKQFYLDELAQIINVLKGDIALVGPRPLAWHHFLGDVESGNVTRKYIKAGIFSETHVRKGTKNFHNLELYFEYALKSVQFSTPALLWHNIKIIFIGLKMILEGKGY